MQWNNMKFIRMFITSVAAAFSKFISVLMKIKREKKLRLKELLQAT